MKQLLGSNPAQAEPDKPRAQTDPAASEGTFRPEEARRVSGTGQVVRGFRVSVAFSDAFRC